MTAPESPSAMVPAWLKPRDEVSRGQAVDRFLVLERLGAGGCATVYCAYDPQLDRKVALKILHPNVSTQGGSAASAMLLAEARAMARLSHPNVVTVYEVGEDAAGAFIAMELMPGKTLAQWLRAEPRPWKSVRDAFVAAGTGLAAAHRHGLVHRDFKPQNVLRSEEGRIAVADFGLAHDFGEVSRTSAAPDLDLMHSWVVTVAGAGDSVIAGTPAYMAPEVMNGSTADERSDQFSLCVSIFEGLYGTRPFRGGSVAELYSAMTSGQPIAPPSNRSVPAWLHRAVLQGLRPEPMERHKDIETLLGALQRDRKSRRTTAALVVVVAALGVAGTLTVQHVLAEPPSAQALTQIDALVDRAHAAAARGYFVHPTDREPATPGAYSLVLELERLPAPLSDAGRVRAEELRAEFSQTLVRLGDEFWSRDGGRPFAADYYAAALVFDPDHEHAASRTHWAPPHLDALRDRVATGELLPGEVVGFEILAALAAPDDEARVERLAAIETTVPSVIAAAQLDALFEPASASAEPRPLVSDASTIETVEDAEVTEASMTATRDEPAPAGSGSPGKDPARSKSEAKAGRRALASGDLASAEVAFHRALRLDNRNASALAGLAEVHFERGQYARARDYAKRAVKLRPRSGAYRVLLGDIELKVLAYSAAKRHYEKAEALGHRAAKDRLARLAKMVGP